LYHLALPGHEFGIKPFTNAVKLILIPKDIIMDKILKRPKPLNNQLIVIIFYNMFHHNRSKVINKMYISIIGKFHISQMNILFVAIKLEQCA